MTGKIRQQYDFPNPCFFENAEAQRSSAQALCDLLSLPRLTALGVTHPKIKIRLLENLSLDLCRKLRKANREIALLV